VTFHSEESSFCVLRVKVKGHRELVTVIGSAAAITPGEFVESVGSWHTDKTHGLQFKTTHLKTVPPSTLEGIEKYLWSGMIKGIGPHFAKILVKAFGVDVFTIIEETPDRLLTLPGIGRKRSTRSPPPERSKRPSGKSWSSSNPTASVLSCVIPRLHSVQKLSGFSRILSGFAAPPPLSGRFSQNWFGAPAPGG
jgi:ATP-dependent exoDNAse (exonuclease V) alpha subunit